MSPLCQIPACFSQQNWKDQHTFRLLRYTEHIRSLSLFCKNSASVQTDSLTNTHHVSHLHDKVELVLSHWQTSKCPMAFTMLSQRSRILSALRYIGDKNWKLATSSARTLQGSGRLSTQLLLTPILTSCKRISILLLKTLWTDTRTCRNPSCVLPGPEGSAVGKGCRPDSLAQVKSPSPAPGSIIDWPFLTLERERETFHSFLVFEVCFEHLQTWYLIKLF